MILLVVTIVASIIIILFIPKRISKLELYTTSLFASLFGTVVDVFLDLKLDLYGFLNKGVDWGYLLILLFVYPAANILFLNFYPEHKSLSRKIIYIFGFSLLSILFEFLALQTSLFYYNGWKLWYSALCYPILYLSLRLNLVLIKKGIYRAKIDHK